MGTRGRTLGILLHTSLMDPTSNPEFSQRQSQPQTTHAQNFDVLIEHYLKPLGIVQAGFFYKSLSDPIYHVTLPFQTATVAALINGPNAHISGIEASWQQLLSFLPGALNGIGVRANYSYTASQATFPSISGQRTDHPTLVRTAPNNWNFRCDLRQEGLLGASGPDPQ